MNKYYLAGHSNGQPFYIDRTENRSYITIQTQNNFDADSLNAAQKRALADNRGRQTYTLFFDSLGDAVDKAKKITLNTGYKLEVYKCDENPTWISGSHPREHELVFTTSYKGEDFLSRSDAEINARTLTELTGGNYELVSNGYTDRYEKFKLVEIEV